MKWLPLLTVPVLVAWSQPSAAQDVQTLTCGFDTECLDMDGCAESSFEIELSYELKPVGPNGMVGRGTKTDINGTTTGIVAIRNDILRYTSGSFHEGTEETLTINGANEARLVATLSEIPMVITYGGRCEGNE